MTASDARHFSLLVILIAAIQATLAAGLFGLTAAVSDSGRPVPGWLGAVASTLGTPGKLLSETLTPSLGIPRSIYIGFGVAGVLWGCAIGLVILYARRRMATRGSR